MEVLSLSQIKKIIMSTISHNTSSKGGGIENSMLSVLFIAGILGAFYFLRQPASTISRTSHTEEEYAQPAGTSEKAAEDRGGYVKVEGIMEQYLPLEFTLHAYNEKVEYVLDFGNGTRQEVRGPVHRYVYRQAGTFHVRLIARYQGIEKILYSEKLRIAAPSELAGF